MSDRHGDDRFLEFLRKAAADYNEPPPTPRDEMWSRIEGSVVEPTLSRMAVDYNRPPKTPRKEMWSRIEAAWQLRASAPETVREAGLEPLAPLEIGEVAEPERTRRVTRMTPWAWGLAVAASLTIGVVIGRQTTGELETGPTVADATQQAVGTERTGGEPVDAGGATSDRRNRAAATHRAATVQHLTRTEAFLTTLRSGAGQSDGDVQVSKWARGLLVDTRLLLDWPVDRDPRMTVLLQELELVLAQIAQLDGPVPEGERSLIIEDLETNDVLPRLRSAIPAGPVAITQSGV